jgi:hypothetical protein
MKFWLYDDDKPVKEETCDPPKITWWTKFLKYIGLIK